MKVVALGICKPKILRTVKAVALSDNNLLIIIIIIILDCRVRRPLF